MGIKVTSGFDLNAPQLLDSKSKQASLADMNALVKNNEVVEGQLCYCTADSKLYILKNGTWSVVGDSYSAGTGLSLSSDNEFSVNTDYVATQDWVKSQITSTLTTAV